MVLHPQRHRLHREAHREDHLRRPPRLPGRGLRGLRRQRRGHHHQGPLGARSGDHHLRGRLQRQGCPQLRGGRGGLYRVRADSRPGRYQHGRRPQGRGRQDRGRPRLPHSLLDQQHQRRPPGEGLHPARGHQCHRLLCQRGRGVRLPPGHLHRPLRAQHQHHPLLRQHQSIRPGPEPGLHCKREGHPWQLLRHPGRRHDGRHLPDGLQVPLLDQQRRRHGPHLQVRRPGERLRCRQRHDHHPPCPVGGAQELHHLCNGHRRLLLRDCHQGHPDLPRDRLDLRRPPARDGPSAHGDRRGLTGLPLHGLGQRRDG